MRPTCCATTVEAVRTGLCGSLEEANLLTFQAHAANETLCIKGIIVSGLQGLVPLDLLLQLLQLHLDGLLRCLLLP